MALGAALIDLQDPPDSGNLEIKPYSISRDHGPHGDAGGEQ